MATGNASETNKLPAVKSPVEGSSSRPLPHLKPLHIGPLVVDPPVLQAPMAGFTNYAYRQIVREFGGAGLQATEHTGSEGVDFFEGTAVDVGVGGRVTVLNRGDDRFVEIAG